MSTDGAPVGDELLRDAVDIHIHTAPDIFARNVTAESAAMQAKAAGMAGIVVKSHSTDTAARAELARDAVGFPVFSGIALNHPVGGLNHHAVIESARQGGRIVWMPTIGARHFRQLAGGAPMLASVIPADEPGLSVLVGDRLTDAALRVLDAVAGAGLTLASGHLSPQETIALFEAARARDIQRLVVTHPHVPFVAMSVAEMKTLAELGAYLEFTDHQPIAERVAIIREVGVAHCLLSTDGGTVEEPTPVQRLRSSVLGLVAAGFSDGDIRYLTSTVPRYLVGLGPRPEPVPAEGAAQ